MHTVAEYLKHAEECRRLAELIAASKDKKALEDLAHAWEKLAGMRQKDITPDDLEIEKL